VASPLAPALGLDRSCRRWAPSVFLDGRMNSDGIPGERSATRQRHGGTFPRTCSSDRPGNRSDRTTARGSAPPRWRVRGLPADRPSRASPGSSGTGGRGPCRGHGRNGAGVRGFDVALMPHGREPPTMPRPCRDCTKGARAARANCGASLPTAHSPRGVSSSADDLGGLVDPAGTKCKAAFVKRGGRVKDCAARGAAKKG